MSWMKENLFKSRKDSIITVVSVLLLGLLIWRVAPFFLFESDWEINRVNLRLLMIGRYPVEHEIRLVIFLISVSSMIGIIAGLIEGKSIKQKRFTPLSLPSQLLDYLKRFGLVAAVIGLLLVWAGTLMPVVFVIGIIITLAVAKFVGRYLYKLIPEERLSYLYLLSFLIPVIALYFVFTPLEKVDDLGGFFLNSLVAIGAILVCIPIGIAMALGRRSKMRVISLLSTTYVEIIRGIPLYVFLLLGGTLVPFFLPGTFAPPKVLTAAIIFTIFTAAYMAEIVRGGLQSLPSGQQEAAQALGLTPIKQTRLIILPQALRNVIPAQVGQLISLFKDTTLAGIALGLLDVLVIARAVTKQDAFRAESRLFETLLFAALLFWVVAYTISKESQRFEKKLGIGL